MARGCARINSKLDTAKIASAGRLEVRRARLLAVIGVPKTFPHGLDPNRSFGGIALDTEFYLDEYLSGLKRK